ncbi:MAG TPA: SDR family NAD(P)-dependent oxidoreductase, partial [Acidobacteriota bacterium]|nr:SDR family NAD(P)-dependent oxidoreductase [Acidobacteriota bacterium]
MQNIEGKVAFITGGGSGIGLGIALAFVKGGMKVVISDIREDSLDEASVFLRKEGGGNRIHPIRLDVTDREGFARAADE